MRLRENKLLDAYFVPVCGELRPKCGVSGLEARLLIFFSAALCAVFGCKMGVLFLINRNACSWGTIEIRTYVCVYMHVIFISFAS